MHTLAASSSLYTRTALALPYNFEFCFLHAQTHTNFMAVVLRSISSYNPHAALGALRLGPGPIGRRRPPPRLPLTELGVRAQQPVHEAQRPCVVFCGLIGAVGVRLFAGTNSKRPNQLLLDARTEAALGVVGVVEVVPLGPVEKDVEWANGEGIP